MDPVKRGLGLQPQVELAVEGGHKCAGNPRDPFSQVTHFDDKILPAHLRSVLTCVRIIAALPARPFPVSWQHKGNV